MRNKRNKRNKSDSHVLSKPDFAMVWRCHGILCSHFYFLFKTSVSKGYFFRNCHTESSLIIAMFKVPSQRLRGTLTTAFLKAPLSWRFYEQGLRYMLILSSKLELTSWNKNQWRYLKNYHSQKNMTLHLHQNRLYFTYFYKLLFLSNKPSLYI